MLKYFKHILKDTYPRYFSIKQRNLKSVNDKSAVSTWKGAKRSDNKDRMLCDFIYVECPQEANPTKKKVD